jgi:hypothetical protein
MNHTSQGSAFIGEAVLTKAVPVFVAVMVWLIRVLVIGTFSLAGENIFTMAENQPSNSKQIRPAFQARPQAAVQTPTHIRPAPKPAPAFESTRPVISPELTYHPVGMNAKSYDGNRLVRK